LARAHALFGWAARLGSRGRTRLVTLWYGIELRWVKSRLPWLKQFLKWALRTSDQVIAISSYTAREIAELVHAPCASFLTGSGFAESLPAAAARRPTDRHVSDLVRRQSDSAQRCAIPDRCLHRLPATIPAKLLILGEGTDRAKLEAQVQELGLDGRVTMPVVFLKADLHRAFHTANVLVLPSIVDQRGDTEGLGVVLLEALSYRVPVIGSAIGGITDIIADGQTGLLVPPEDAAAIAAALERIATDPALAARLAEAGSRRVREQFGWDWMDRGAEQVAPASKIRKRGSAKASPSADACMRGPRLVGRGLASESDAALGSMRRVATMDRLLAQQPSCAVAACRVGRVGAAQRAGARRPARRPADAYSTVPSTTALCSRFFWSAAA